MVSNLGQIGARILESVRGCVYPRVCYICGKEASSETGYLLCEDCLGSIRLNDGPVCRKCGHPLRVYSNGCEFCKDSDYLFDSAFSAGIYEGTLREAIHLFKYESRLELESVFFDIMIDFAEKCIDMSLFDWIACVPLHKIKERERSFNQAGILARHFSEIYNIPFFGTNLLKIRKDLAQIELSREARRKSVRDSFKVKRPDLTKGRRFLLIDDVFTTGSTLNECTRTLLKSGASGVSVFTLAKDI